MAAAPSASSASAERLQGLPSRDLPGGLKLVEAATPAARLRGLARLDGLPADVALHIPRCRSVHTFTMRFPLDLIWLDAAGAVVRVDERVPPRRFKSCRAARSVIETLGGHSAAFVAALA